MSDYNFLMESRLSPEQVQVLSQLSHVAVEQGLNLYLVGGAVRDLTYGQQTVHDLDFVLEGNPQRILRHLESARAATPRSSTPPASASEKAPLKIDSIHMDSRLNSAEVHFSNAVRMEISMSRSETYVKPGRAPEISPAMIFDDLKRRDLSINAMAVSLHPNSRGLLLDPANGAADIEKRELRVMHNRSFSDDPTRIYRVLRLGLRLGFKPEERTRIYLDAALENRLWERMEPQQQGRELRSILQEENPSRVFKMLGDRGLLTGLDKKLSAKKIPYERFAKIRAASQSIAGATPYLLNFYCLVEKYSSGQKTRLAKKIIGDSKAIQTALTMERSARKLAQALSSSKNAQPSRVYKLLTGQPQNLLLFLLAYFPQTKIQNRIKSFLHKFPLVRARLPRVELQAIGMKPSPKFEKIIEQVFLDQLDGKIKTPQQMMKQLRALSGIKEPPPPPPPPPPKPPKPVKPPKPALAVMAAKEPDKSKEPLKLLKAPKSRAAARASKKKSKPAKKVSVRPSRKKKAKKQKSRR
ncbi:MAG: tRNA nucleotidyltransferase/poly(A) polymerase family protein [Terriglobia bacterium]